ncbi:MAG: hypothetical protein ACYDCO_19550 [Armatimonadota bacterium]
MKTRAIIKGVLVVLGLLVLGTLGTIGWQAYVSELRAEPLVGMITDNQQQVPFRGINLRGCTVYISTESGSIPEQDMITLIAKSGNLLKSTLDVKAIPETTEETLYDVYRPEYITVDIAPVWDMLRNGDKLRFKFVRGSLFSRLVPGWLTYRCVTKVEVSGSLLPVSVQQEKSAHLEPFPMLYNLFKPRFKAGDVVRLPGLKFGMQRGTITCDGKPLQVLHWTDTEIIFRIPEKAKPGESLVFEITSSDNRSHKFLASIAGPATAIPTAPQLDKTATASVTAGQTVQVGGTSFGNPGTVAIASRGAEITFWSDRAVGFTVPDNVPPGLRKVIISRADKQSVSFFIRVKGEAAPKPPAPSPAVAALLQGYQKLTADDAEGARARFDESLAKSGADTAEGTAIRALIRLMHNPEDEEAREMARKASQLAKTARERGLAYLATGWDPAKREDWNAAKKLGDPQVKALADLLLANPPENE